MILRSGRRASARSVACAPSIPGMAKSMKTMSASNSGSMARNSSPLAASPTTRHPAQCSSSPLSPLRKSEWSSTSTIVRSISFAFAAAEPLRCLLLLRIDTDRGAHPRPLALAMSNTPPSELMRDEMFESPMPQSIMACGLNPARRPYSPVPVPSRSATAKG